MRTNWAALALVFACLPAAWGGVDGQWAAVTQSGPSGVLLELKSEGGRLTGWLSQPAGRLEISNGSIRGDAVSFEMAVHIQEKSLTLLYDGQVVGDELRLRMRVSNSVGEQQLTMKRVDPKAPLELYAESAAPEEVIGWIRSNAIRLASVQAGSDFADMGPLEARLQNARIVAMGEATHGTREFQQFKFRLFRFLVEKLGFTVFAIEDNWPESLAVNDYVQGRDVDPLGGLGFNWWKTQDMLDMLRWMRQYNQNPAHTHKLKFYGVDMQAPRLAEANVLAYLARVDPEYRETAARPFETLGEWAENKQYETASAETKKRTAESLAAILRRFDERKADDIAKSSAEEWEMARQNMVIVQQAEVKLGDQGDRGTALRDRAMAENAKWILDREPPGTRMMVWAHNGHVAKAAPLDNPGHLPMGGRLRELYGDQAVSCGFVFRAGGFRAVDMATNAVASFTVGPPPRGSLDATLAAAGMPMFALDLRRLTGGTVADWFDAPHISRQIGGGYAEATPGVWLHRIRAARQFDLLIYVGETTPSKP